MSEGSPLFSFVQVEFPWQLGPPDGRYLVRNAGDGNGSASHVVVLGTLGAPERRRISARRRPRDAQPRPAPTPVATARATVIDVGRPLEAMPAARAWLDAAGEDELRAGLEVLNRTLHGYRLATADPYLAPLGRRQALVTRVGFGAGEEVADGLWTAARELPGDAAVRRRRGRRGLLAPQERLAAVLGGRETPLVCEELTLRARIDLDHDRPREAALQLLVALDAALAELREGEQAAGLAERLGELRTRRDAVAAAAQAALTRPLSPAQLETVALTVSRVEAALRARALARASRDGFRASRPAPEPAPARAVRRRRRR